VLAPGLEELLEVLRVVLGDGASEEVRGNDADHQAESDPLWLSPTSHLANIRAITRWLIEAAGLLNIAKERKGTVGVSWALCGSHNAFRTFCCPDKGTVSFFHQFRALVKILRITI